MAHYDNRLFMLTILTDRHQKMTRIRNWIWAKNVPPASRRHQWFRLTVRTFAILMREFKQDHIPLRANALTFSVILALVPAIALGTAVLKGLGAGDQAREAAYRMIDQMESQAEFLPDFGTATPLNETSAGANGPPLLPAARDQPAAQKNSLTSHLRSATDTVFSYVDKTDFTALGAFGVGSLLIVVFFLFDTIAEAMDAIWQVDQARPFGRKVMDYMALLVLFPLVINFSMATAATLHSPALLEKFVTFFPAAGLTHVALKLLPMALIIAVFTMFYRFLPNTKVLFHAALVGGIFGGIAWFFVQGIYIKLQIGVARYNAIYGSFATLPLFLVWLEIGWIVFLVGAEMSFAVQHIHVYRFTRSRPSATVMLNAAFSLVRHLYQGFFDRIPVDMAYLVEKTGYDDCLLLQLIELFRKKNLIKKIAEKGSITYLPAVPAERLAGSEIVVPVLAGDDPPPAGTAAARILERACNEAELLTDLPAGGWTTSQHDRAIRTGHGEK